MSTRMHDTHDSIEDARTALALYEKWVQLAAAGRVEQVTLDIYAIGRETHWQVPDGTAKSHDRSNGPC